VCQSTFISWTLGLCPVDALPCYNALMKIHYSYRWLVPLVLMMIGTSIRPVFVDLESKARAASSDDWMLGSFTRPQGVNPLITPKADSTFQCPLQHKLTHWEAAHTFNPAAIVLDGKVCVLYRAEDDSGANHIGGHTSRLGLAQSDDGLHFARRETPVFYPDADAQKDNEAGGGCEDPRLIYGEDGTIILTYTQWNQKIPRLAIATTRDLLKWDKHGPAFADASGGKYLKMACKSATILGKFVEDKLTATKVYGKYWMYWGEGDMHFATSTDLIHWQPLEDANGKMRVSLNRRKGKFDSDLAEGGPAAILTERGILVIYNGKNGKDGDPSLGVGAYSGGQALFDLSDPSKLLKRTETPFYQPELPFEKSGQYGAGTTFLEGLVVFKGQCFLYYGCADSFVGVAVCYYPHL
jgi:predicted GH43/DUF377 family glycosyl hydrolase